MFFISEYYMKTLLLTLINAHIIVLHGELTWALKLDNQSLRLLCTFMLMTNLENCNI